MTTVEEPGRDPRADWPTRVQAARTLRASESSVRRMVERGELREVYVGGAYRIDPDELAEIDRKRRPDELATTLGHAERLIRLVYEPAEKHIELLQASVAALQARCADLERAHTEAVRAREAALSESAEREILRERERAEQARRDQSMALLVRAAGQIEAKLRERGAIASVLSRLSDEQWAVLRSTGIVEEHEAAELSRLRNRPEEKNGKS